MNILIDQHHADLLESMHRIFADRFGMDVYIPIGHEWWDEGYWSFGRGTWPDDRLAQQYLNTDRWTDVVGGTYVTRDGSHPDRLLYGVTLERARRMKWAYIMATVQDNQTGFYQFANEMGAQYLLQVGNTGQYVDWSLEPFALVSSEVPTAGKHVLMHQPFDHTGVFRYRPPEPSDRIASFVNNMPFIQCWPVLEQYRAALPDFQWAVHGIAGEDGILQPVSAIADAMAASAFVWHDKAHGDGFGHVIHNAAAVGRPLIGHASHYWGMVPHHLWRDGETCIDLDVRTFEENVALIREIAADPDRHRAMCERIREEFETIRWDDELAAIADGLGLPVVA
jgi:hypothetical protein